MKTRYLPKRLLEKFREVGFDCNDDKVSIEQAQTWLKENLGMFVGFEQFLSHQPSGICVMYRYCVMRTNGTFISFWEGCYKSHESAVIAGIRKIVNEQYRFHCMVKPLSCT